MLREDVYAHLRNQLVVDKLRLDDDLIEMPQWQQDAGECYIEAQMVRDQAKHYLEVVEANVSRDLRNAVFTDIKGRDAQRSEAQIKSEIAADESVQEAQQTVITAEYDVGLWRTLCDNLRSKGHSIRAIVDLMAQGYTSASVVQSSARRGSIASRPPPQS